MRDDNVSVVLNYGEVLLLQQERCACTVLTICPRLFKCIEVLRSKTMWLLCCVALSYRNAARELKRKRKEMLYIRGCLCFGD